MIQPTTEDLNLMASDVYQLTRQVLDDGNLMELLRLVHIIAGDPLHAVDNLTCGGWRPLDEMDRLAQRVYSLRVKRIEDADRTASRGMGL